MVGIVSGINEPTRPPNQQSSMGRFDDKAISIKCMVNGCNNDRDLSSTQHLCRLCYDVITTGNTDRYYETHQGSTWIGQIITWNYNLKSEVNELEYNQEHAYFREDGNTMSLNDLRNFYVEHKNDNKDEIIDDLRKKFSDLEDMYKNHCAVSQKQCSELATSLIMVKSLKEVNEALKKDHEYKSHIIDRLEKEIKALNYNMDHAHEDDGKFLTVDDLCIFYDENHGAKKHIEYLSDKITDLRNEIHDMEAKLAEKTIFDTNTKDQFAERAKINEEKQSVKFVGYTEGFWKGFDMGYEKAKEQFDE